MRALDTARSPPHTIGLLAEQVNTQANWEVKNVCVISLIPVRAYGAFLFFYPMHTLSKSHHVLTQPLTNRGTGSTPRVEGL